MIEENERGGSSMDDSGSIEANFREKKS